MCGCRGVNIAVGAGVMVMAQGKFHVGIWRLEIEGGRGTRWTGMQMWIGSQHSGGDRADGREGLFWRDSSKQVCRE